jgi:hypothetical protein
MALLSGDVWESLLWNPFTIPIALLFAVSISSLTHCWFRSTPLVLPPGLSRAWIVLLTVAWVTKFAIGPDRW